MKYKAGGKMTAFRNKYLAATVFLSLIFSFAHSQVLQIDPAYGRQIKRYGVDSAFYIPKGLGSTRISETGKDTAQLRYNKTDSGVYVYTGSQWLKVGGSGSGGGEDLEETLLNGSTLNTNYDINSTKDLIIRAQLMAKFKGDSLLWLHQKRNDSSERYITFDGEGVNILSTNSDETAASAELYVEEDSARGKFKLTNTDIVLFNVDSGAANPNAVLYRDPVTKKLKIGSVAAGSVDTTSLSNRINEKLNISDTSAMLSSYLRKIDTAELSRKSMGAYSIKANNTNATANAAELVYKSFKNLTYGGTVTWTHSGTAPSGTPVIRYSWRQIDKEVSVRATCYYPTNGTSVTAATFTWPSDLPLPEERTGTGASDDVIEAGVGFITTNYSTEPTNTARAFIKINSADNSYEVKVVGSSVSARYCIFNITYTAQ